MNKRTIAAALLGASLALGMAASVSAAPAKEPTCRGCHGAKGAKPIAPNYPKLKGQNAAYLVEALKAYKNGGRSGGLAGVMQGMAAGLSDSEMQELADYYSKQ